MNGEWSTPPPPTWGKKKEADAEPETKVDELQDRAAELRQQAEGLGGNAPTPNVRIQLGQMLLAMDTKAFEIMLKKWDVKGKGEFMKAEMRLVSHCSRAFSPPSRLSRRRRLIMQCLDLIDLVLNPPSRLSRRGPHASNTAVAASTLARSPLASLAALSLTVWTALSSPARAAEPAQHRNERDLRRERRALRVVG